MLIDKEGESHLHTEFVAVRLPNPFTEAFLGHLHSDPSATAAPRYNVLEPVGHTHVPFSLTNPTLHSQVFVELFHSSLVGHLHTLPLIGLSELYVIIAPVYV